MVVSAEMTKRPDRDAQTLYSYLYTLRRGCGLLSAALFTVLWIVAGVFETHYDNLRHDISDFGALTASHPLRYNTALPTERNVTIAP